MGFQVKYEEITSIRELILAQLDRWIEQIDAVRSSIVEIAAMSEMHGEAAEHVRSYMWDYHMNLANMIKDTIETYRSSFILYTDWYYNIDSDQLAEMSQDSMEGLEENIQGARSDFDAVAEEVADIERELSAYLDVGRFSTTCMESCFDNALAGVQNVRTQIGEYEEAHSHADMYPIDMMAGYLRSIIGGQLGGSSATISAYDASVVNATESFQLAQMMDGMLSTYLEQVKDRVNSCEEFYELQQQQWQESIRLRTEEGIVKTLVGVGTMILGGMLVVATCGMALPLVATVGVMAIGAGTVAYGFSNTVEGGQDVYAGVTGDPRMVSVNPIRDTVFASNPDLYYLIGNVLTIAASLILTGGMAANAAVSAGTSIGRAVVTEYAKQGLTMAASSYVEKSMTEATNSPLAGFVVGSLTGMATYGTLSEAELEVVNNVKRPQQLGNVGESSSNAKNPMTGDDWHNYFNETYGADNVTWESASIQDIIDMPSKITDFSPKQISDLATKNGWTVEPLGKGSLAGIPYEQGGGLSMHAPNGSSIYIQYHPGSGHHGVMPYYKISSGKNGIVRYYINGESTIMGKDIEELMQCYDRFVDIVKQISMNANEQIVKLKGTIAADELANDFSEIGMMYAKELLENEWITQEQYTIAKTIDEMLVNMSKRKELWSEEALFNAEEWDECRKKGNLLLKMIE